VASGFLEKGNDNQHVVGMGMWQGGWGGGGHSIHQGKRFCGNKEEVAATLAATAAATTATVATAAAVRYPGIQYPTIIHGK
jgi:hypothetical protein